MQVVNIAEKLSQLTDYWSPRIVGELNGHHVKVVKLKGEFVWHQHLNEDEMFFLVSGRLRMRLRDREFTIEGGEFFIVPRGTDHLPIAEEECAVLLFEPASTLNTGNLHNERTVADPKWI